MAKTKNIGSIEENAGRISEQIIREAKKSGEPLKVVAGRTVIRGYNMIYQAEVAVLTQASLRKEPISQDLIQKKRFDFYFVREVLKNVSDIFG